MNAKRLIYLVLIMFWISGAGLLTAQDTFQLSSEQELKVSGTSTLHDWDMVSHDASGKAEIEVEGREIKSIKALQVSFPVKSLKSGNSRMDRTAYSSIDADKHPQVRFELTQVRNITPQQVHANGNLTISGQTRPVTIRANYSVNGGTVKFTGVHSIKFTQFNVDPPTALLGTVRTGDEMQISFDVNFINAR